MEIHEVINMLGVLGDVQCERISQDERWGQQDHPDGTGMPGDRDEADIARAACEGAFERGEGTYRDILLEEVAEAFAESDPRALRAELVQVAAVAVAWVEKIDRDLIDPCNGQGDPLCPLCGGDQ